MILSFLSFKEKDTDIMAGVTFMEKTFLMVKPDGVQRELIGEIVSRFEKKGFQLIGAKLMNISNELASEHYGEHKERPFFGELVEFITSGPVFAMVWQGENVIATARQMMGSTNPADAAPGTIRGDFGVTVGKNIIHGSDSPESAKREIGLFFNDSELIEYSKLSNNWIY
ncbi:nucleoside diphosphate kinase [Siminovitchia terrae]|uniref:Nucleoside diphosphate kinase n=2 Tax=Siminovitchia terrae TaxID=1914933 RepID=A0ABQ4KWV9_SIMTE|nr:nucleoside diphosphate kinase [Siminovitchia terrae]